ncbi:MAG TPA: SEC-C metal-binding domain-containing protein, partial [Chloroflexia bacterium]|nr:SEC-C metal-binding domain-containing protein [Chloroflexia bacterium]
PPRKEASREAPRKDGRSPVGAAQSAVAGVIGSAMGPAERPGASRGGGPPNQRAGKGPARVPAGVGVTSKTPGRNDPCPCGSGRKYKVCHGR